MPPKEKAKELFGLFDNSRFYTLQAVDLVLKEFFFDDSDYSNRRYQYYLEVQAEIKKL